MSNPDEHMPTSAEVLHWMDPDASAARGKTAAEVAAMQEYAGVGPLYHEVGPCNFEDHLRAADERGWIDAYRNGIWLLTERGKGAIQANRRRIAAEGEDR